MSTQDTQVNTVCYIFLPKKKQIKYLKSLYLRRVARTCIFAKEVGLIVLIRSLGPKAHVIATSYLFLVL